MGSATGLTAAGLAGLHAAAERHVGDDRAPGLVALVARGGQVHVEALGRLAAGGSPVARDAIFRIASTTKAHYCSGGARAGRRGADRAG